MENFNDVTTRGKSSIRLFMFERYKIVFAILVFLIAVIVGLFIGVIVLATTRKGPPACATNEMCTDKDCIMTASTILAQINETFDPCEDFYGFVCHDWMEQNPLPDGYTSWSPMETMGTESDKDAIDVLEQVSEDTDPKFAKNVRIFYESCTNTTAIRRFNIAELIPLVRALGGWPVFDPTWDESKFDWRVPAAASTLWNPRDNSILYPRGYLVGVKPDRDFEDTSKYILYVGFSLDIMSPFYQFLHNNTEKYIAYGVAVLVRLGADPNAAKQDMTNVAKFEKELIEIMNRRAQELKAVPKEFKENIFSAKLEAKHMSRDTMNGIFEKMRVADLGKNLGQGIDWHGLLNVVLNEVQTTIDESTEVRVAFPHIMKGLNDLFVKTPLRTIANYLMWRLLTDNFEDAMTDFVKDIVYPSQPCRETLEARSSHCLTQTNLYMGKQVGRLYIDDYLDLSARSDVLDLKDKIRDAMNTMMEDADWMDETTRNRAIDKLKKVTFSAGYSEDLMDDDLLNELTGKGPFHPEKYVPNKILSAHYTNTLWLTQYKNQGGILDKIRQNTLWSINNPTSVNAAYVRIRNWVEVNAAFLQPPAYDEYYNDALKYGITGFMIGHELGHGFDSLGRNYDANGNLRDWWTSESSNNFNDRANCMVEQYNKYKIEEVNKNVDGQLTLAENIADNGGIKAAFKAYQMRNKEDGPEKRLAGLEKYSPEQLFFISYARFFCANMDKSGMLSSLKGVHSPDSVRVIGPLSNYEEFSKAYKCRPGSKYNPTKKCAVW